MSGLHGALFGGSVEVVLNISNLAAPSINTLLAAAGWDAVAPVRLEVNAGALVNTLDIPDRDYPNGLYLYIGAAALIGGLRGGPGLRGGFALRTRRRITIENYGSFKGGGGGGGSGGSAWVQRYAGPVWGYGGAGGAGQGFANAGSLAIVAATPGDGGSSSTDTSSSGGGSWGGGAGSATASGGNGGDGGAWRQPGWGGSSGALSGSYTDGYSEGGTPGAAAGLNVDGLEHVTWVVRGDA